MRSKMVAAVAALQQLLLLLLLADGVAAGEAVAAPETLLRAPVAAAESGAAASDAGTLAEQEAPEEEEASASQLATADARRLLSGPTGEVDARIVGGVLAQAGRYRWTVSLQRKKIGHSCGGTLVTSKFVLTAAHCLESPIASVVLGVQDLKASSGRLVRRATRVIMHPQYSNIRNLNDIGLVELDAPVTTLTPVLLASSEPTAGTLTTVVGWGTATFGGNMQSRLREVSIPTVSRADCTASGAYSKLSIHTSNICAGFAEGAKDSCQGDSGGPLFLPTGSDANDTQVGVVSWGSGCARPLKYGVYSKVSSFRAWIASVVGAQNLRKASRARVHGGGM
jgi:trypsin